MNSRALFLMAGWCGIALADPSPFALQIDAPAAKVGAAAQAHIKLTPNAGYHVNKEFPTSLKLVPPAGVDLPKPTLTAKDGVRVSENGADADVTYTAKEAGKKIFSGVFSFAVCSAANCAPQREKVSFTVDVK